MRLTLTIATILTLACSQLFAQDFNKGYEAAKAGDYSRAIKEWQPLAELGDIASQHNLGWMYQNGLGVLQDYTEAVKWYRLAAEQGDKISQSSLGHIYQMGEGVPRDYSKALKWHRLAAEQNNAPSQVSLGVLYESGGGVIKDNVTAHMWYNIASANGIEEAGEWRDGLEDSMTPEAIEKATTIAQECMANDYKKCGY